MSRKKPYAWKYKYWRKKRSQSNCYFLDTVPKWYIKEFYGIPHRAKTKNLMRRYLIEQIDESYLDAHLPIWKKDAGYFYW